jgi:formate-dependent nitrite reductase membrane component NrfD
MVPAMRRQKTQATIVFIFMVRSLIGILKLRFVILFGG